MTNINSEWLTEDGMVAARAALIARFPWFLHCTPVENFHSIQATGLQPRNPGCLVNPVIAAKLKVENAAELICLRPLGTSDSTPRRGARLFKLAVPAPSLPATVTIDWTFSGTWELGPILCNDYPSGSAEEIFCEIARRRGSVAVYEAISPNALRVWTKDCSDLDPAMWPRLRTVNFEDLA
jgi:hypothetical protein